jgi:hypothetical protein
MLAEESLSAPDRSSLEICQCRYGVIFDLDLEEVFFFLLLCAVSFRYQWRQPFNEEVGYSSSRRGHSFGMRKRDLRLGDERRWEKMRAGRERKKIDGRMRTGGACLLTLGVTNWQAGEQGEPKSEQSIGLCKHGVPISEIIEIGLTRKKTAKQRRSDGSELKFVDHHGRSSTAPFPLSRPS